MRALLLAAALAVFVAGPAHADPVAPVAAAPNVPAASPAPVAFTVSQLPAPTPIAVVPAAAPSADDPSGIATSAISAVESHNWWLLISVLLIGTVWATRTWGAKFLPPKLEALVQTNLGGVVLTLIGAFGGALASAAAAHQAITAVLLLSSLKLAAASSGLYVWAGHLLDAKNAAAANAAPPPPPAS